MGSLRAVSNQNGKLLKEVTYDTFGNIIFDSNTSLKIPFGFAGGLYDSDTKLVRFGFRDYDPFTGRWTAKDPILFNGGDTNLYGYVLGDPVSGIDTEGLRYLSQKQCLKLKEMLEFEKNYGTLPMAIKYSATWGNPDYRIKSSGKNRLGGDYAIPTSIGYIDLDWYLDLASFGYGIQAPILYILGKSIWNFKRDKSYYNMYEPKEKVAIKALMKYMSLSDLFPDCILDSLCN